MYLIKDIQEYINKSWEKSKNIKIVKVNNKYQVLTGFQYFKYIVKKINSLEKFNTYFNQSRNTFIIKIVIIIAVIIGLILLKNFIGGLIK